MPSATIEQTVKAGEQYYQAGTALSRLLAEAPYLSRCSDNKTAALVRPREYAVRYPYMQVNRPGMVSWLIFDLDHSNSLIWEDENLPAPNIVVTNRKNGHAHLFYAIVPVCTSNNARSKPIQYMKAVYAAMAARLDADPSYRGPVAKTPGHPWWKTWEIHNHIYDLDELSDYVDLSPRPRWGSGPDLDSVSHSRHCLLFEDLSHYAYSIVNRERARGTYKTFERLLEVYAYSKNNYRQRGFSMNLRVSQVNATVRSVACWTWVFYTGNSRCHRGVMGLPDSLSLKEKQTLSAKRTHGVRKRATESKIRDAANLLLNKGEKITQVAIGRISRLSRQTVAKYMHIIEEVQEKLAQTTNLRGENSQKINVNYGVHQITAHAIQGNSPVKPFQIQINSNFSNFNFSNFSETVDVFETEPIRRLLLRLPKPT